MSIIADVDLNTALQYKGLNLRTKYNGKKHSLYFKLVCDDFTLLESIQLASVSSNILMVEYQGLDTNPAYRDLQNTGVYVGRITDFGNNLTEEDLRLIVQDTPSGVVPIIRLQNDFSDLHLLWELSKKYPMVRFCGGMLFSVDGVKTGAVGVDILDAKGVKYDMRACFLNGTDDAIEVVPIGDLTIETNSKSASGAKSGKSATKKEPAKKKPQISFANIMSSQGTVMP